MTNLQRRLAGYALVIGGAIGIAGYLAVGIIVGGSGDARFIDPLWQPLYSIALAGVILVILGFPATLIAQDGRFPRLTAVGYAGTLAALVMLNLGEGVIEGFVKPYLVTHGGIPSHEPAGFAAFETVALVCMVVGLVSLGVAVLRAGTLPRWVGVLLIVSPFVSFAAGGLPGPFAELPDYGVYLALMAMGWQAVGPVRGLVSRPSVRISATPEATTPGS